MFASYYLKILYAILLVVYKKHEGENMMLQDMMFRMLMISMDILPAALILVPLLLMLQCTLWRPVFLQTKLWMIVLALYLAGVFSVTGIPNLKSMEIDLQVWLLPFIDIVSDPLGYIKNTVLNMLLFVPFGFLLPVIWKKFQAVQNTVLSGFLLSLAIEVSQLLTFRLTDVDDLITNTLGTAAGYYVAQRFLGNNKLSRGQRDNEKELIVIVSCALLVMFFIQPYLCAWIWDSIL